MISVQGRPVLVVGDVMLDHYVHGHAGRLSPEAPVPVLAWRRDQWVAGGAANVAANIAALGGDAQLVGVVGEDSAARDLGALLLGLKAKLEPTLVADAGRHTTVKTRFVSNGQQLLRLDREDACDVGPEVAAALLTHVERLAPGAAVVVLSDYRKGALTAQVIERTIAASRAAGVPIVVDPKRADWSVFRGATVITPNRAELEQATGLSCGSDPEVERAARHAARETGAAILVTRSERGMTLVRGDEPALHIQAEAREVFDVSGAGDTVVAAVAIGLSASLPLSEVVRVANTAAGLVVTKHGTATVSLAELNQALRGLRRSSGGAVDRAEVIRLRQVWREQGQVVGFTNGCFDILHPGHVRLIGEAAQSCDRLIVALNTDASVRRLKGPARPIQDEAARSAVMAALSGVDAVVLFDEDTPFSLIDALRPDLLVKGADYREDEVVGADIVRAAGGRVLLVGLVDGESTTGIIARSERAG